MSEPSQSASVLPQLEHTATSPKKLNSANTQFTDLSSRLDQQQLNASKPIKASVKAASGQPSVATLANLGIKVRDFAYESKLPPIQPIYRHPRQIQPAVVRTALKRQWTETGQDDPFSQSSSQPESSQKKLERTSTEPVIPPIPGPSARMLGLMNIEDFDREYDSLRIYSQQPNIFAESPSHSQMAPSIFESQESEPYVDTPPVTPKGSLQWPVSDTSNIPASQLDTESQAMVPGLLSCSQLRFPQTPERSLSQRPASPNPSSPLASVLSLASIQDGLSLSKTIISTPSRPRGKSAASPDQRPTNSTHDAHTQPNPRISATRYHLRKRPAPPSSPFSPTKSSSGPHNLRHRAVIPPSRPRCVSIQSSQSRAKPKGESSSPSSRTLLRRAVTNGQEKRRRMG